MALPTVEMEKLSAPIETCRRVRRFRNKQNNMAVAWNF
jgi:hypothetical protein